MSQKAKIWKLFAIRNHLRSPFRETRNYRKRRQLCGGLRARCRKYRIFANRHTANIIISQIAILISQMLQKAKIWKLFEIRDYLRSPFRETRNYRKRRHLCRGLRARCRKYRIFANRHTANIIISQIAILISQMSQKDKIWKLFAIHDHLRIRNHLRSPFCETRNYRKM